jgi:hypothetical protein
VIWGALHGLYVVFFGLTGDFWKRFSATMRLNRFPKVENGLAMLVTFILVSFAWIFFRADSLPDSLDIVQGLFKGWPEFMAQSKVAVYQGLKAFEGSGFSALVDAAFAILGSIASEPRSTVLMTLFALGILLVIEIKQARGDFLMELNSRPIYIRAVSYAALITVILIFGTAYTGTQQAFIYFQF